MDFLDGWDTGGGKCFWMLENPFITVFFHLTYLSVLVQCILYNDCYIKGGFYDRYQGMGISSVCKDRQAVKNYWGGIADRQ